jgi:hypothetical protein
MKGKLIKYFRLTLITLFAFIGTSSFSQKVMVDAQLDTTAILIGEQVDFRIKLQIPENEPFMWPQIGDTLPEKIEVLQKSKIDTTSLGDGYMNVEQLLKLTVFDSGYYVIRPLEFLYGQDYSSSVETEPYLLNVFTVEVDTTAAIKPIKGPIAAPITFAEILPWGIAGIVALVVIILLSHFLMKRKKKEPVVFRKPKPKLPPHRVALDAFERLKNEKLWQQGKVKDYHSEISDIMRVYIEGTYNIAAMEMTTWEIIRSFAGAKIEQANLEKLRQILEMADLVKFAKLKPLPDENEYSLEQAELFVRRTMPKSEPEKAIADKVESKPEVTEAS